MDLNSRIGARVYNNRNEGDVDEFGRERKFNSHNRKPYDRPYNQGGRYNEGRQGGYRSGNYNSRNSNRNPPAGPPIDKKLENLKMTIITVGDEADEISNLEALTEVLCREYYTSELYTSEIKTTISNCIKELVYKNSIYIALIGLLNERNSVIGKEILDNLFQDLQVAINNLDWRLIRVFLRTIGGLIQTNIISSSSTINILDNLLQPVLESNTPSFRSSCLAWIVGSTLLFIGKPLLKKEYGMELGRLIDIIEGYHNIISENPIIARINRPFGGNQNGFLDTLVSILRKQISSGFENELLANTCESYESNFSSATTHDPPELDLSTVKDIEIATKGGKAGKRMDYYEPNDYMQWVLDDNEDEDISIEKYMFYELIADCISVVNTNRKAAARLLHSINSVSKVKISSSTISPASNEDMVDDQIAIKSEVSEIEMEKSIIVVLFSLMFDLPFNEQPAVYYMSLTVELRKINPEVYSKFIETAINKIISRSVDTECMDRLADFHSLYLSNFEYIWDYNDTPNPQFMKTSISKQIRLSYYDNIKETCRDNPDLISETKPTHKFKFLVSNMDEDTKNVSIAVGRCIKNNGTGEEVLNILNQHYGANDQVYEKLEMLIEHMLLSGSKSFSHLLNSIEKYKPVVEAICSQISANDYKLFIASIIKRFWAGNSQFLAIAIDKYLNYQIINPQSIVDAMMTEDMEWVNYDHWEIVSSLVSKLVLRVNQLKYRIGQTDSSREQEMYMLNELLAGLEKDLEQTILQILVKFSEFDTNSGNNEMAFGRYIEFCRKYCHQMVKYHNEISAQFDGGDENLRLIFDTILGYY
ncbi:hypothetical protein BB559_000711 [Furculomyces boomerangus]|uniref:MIF4G domain-containing protein n=1 Tax=Furculomyces boomerangus TaxID=61424 RepID=A0A2T9Z4B2_9FUNG|nr:hypothetical protein BB559_000711 [Furculomyces boomerangus]